MVALLPADVMDGFSLVYLCIVLSRLDDYVYAKSAASPIASWKSEQRGKAMLTRRVLVSFVTLLFLSPSALANDVERLVGNWKLLSFFTEDVQTKQHVNLFGEQPTGAIAFTPGGRFFAIITAEGRKAPRTPEEQAAAYRTMVAYTGKWRLEGDRLVTKVDVAWNPAWVGTDQDRFWRFEGNKLFAITPPIPNPNVAGGIVTVTAVWEKEP